MWIYIYIIYIYRAELLFEAFMKASESRQRGVCFTHQAVPFFVHLPWATGFG